MILCKAIFGKAKTIFDLIDSKEGIIFDLLIILICIYSFGHSWVESIITTDNHHWGFMFSQALDMKRGLIPHKEFLLSYGYMTTWIQSISLTILGKKIVSIGIVTGLFYSLNLFLSYRIFLIFLPKYLSTFCTFLIFSLHVFIFDPWPNYYCYTFQLLSIFLFIRGRKNIIYITASGFFLGLSFLARYTSAPAILPPFLIVLGYELLVQKNSRKIVLKTIAVFGLGFITPIILFFGFLFDNNAFGDFLIQNKVLAVLWGFERLEKDRSIFLSLLSGHADKDKYLFFVVNFLSTLLITSYLLFDSWSRKKRLSRNENIFFLLCLTSLFGYLNSIHIFDVWRLVNGSSIGFGVIAYYLMTISQGVKRNIKMMILLPLISVCFVWASYGILKTSFDHAKLTRYIVRGGISTSEISIFQGKIFRSNYYNFHHEIFESISELSSLHYIINFTQDPVIMLMNDLRKVQLSSIYLPTLADEYTDESERIQQVINEKDAVILTSEEFQAPGYEVIHQKAWDRNWNWYHKKIFVIAPSESRGNKEE
ncbi:glycosyltransferase family 39 protein [Synechococcus sp. PCC 7336]|uniref:ArnT family glycosyltransferase n=1 Tax=Synechococcus sp. PCC 7336 TaxID=195250 RepID=UPI0003471513|nr:glycosyltransferase family 39 protein [Synechococcus sp. PCC 7336]